jgi:hypothetical protein
MTEEQHNKFLTLLMGECWHEWEDDGAWNICQICGDKTRLHNPENPNHLSNPLPVIKWMEKEMPEVLEGYAEDLWFKRLWDTNMQMIMAFLDLRNLTVYLVAHPSWGEKEECEQCRGTGEQHDYRNAWVCEVCFGTGKLIHPALQWAREVKDEV